MADYQDFKMDGKTLDITRENIAAMKQLFPEIVTDGKVDFEKLRLILGDEVETSDERYNFTWHGKNQAIRLSQTPSMGTLRPCKEDSVNWDTTKNLYIEGDNLEVLKLLQRSYFGRIKMIYIDPPYNTGGDFVYSDNYSDTISNYLQITQQLSGDGSKLSSNTESDGRFHTNWLNMIYPRIKLARNLLSDEGSIFISIDDNELDNLIKICNEIFGESNKIACVVWKRKRGRDNSAKWFSKSHEYLLVYAKNKEYFVTNYLDLDEETKQAYRNPDNDPRGPYRMLGTWARGTQGGVEYDFTDKNGQYFSSRLWLMSKDKLTQLDLEDKLIVRGDNIYRKMFIFENKGKIPETLWDHTSNAANASDEIKKLFGEIVFDTPKPVPYLQEMVKIATDKNSIILDFFSGSATMAHAVMLCNKNDGGNRKFIMIQFPEICKKESNAYKNGFSNICEIGLERIRRAGLEIKKGSVQSTLDGGVTTVDIGFRIFHLDSSNIRKWSPGLDLRNSLLSFENNLISDPSRNDMDIVFEILLKLGLDLNSNVEEKQNYYSVENGTLMICLKDVASIDIAQAMIDEFKEKEPLVWKVVFKDNGFASDDVKANTRETLKMAGLQEGSFITL